jgi:hypothetical protein
MLERRLQRRLLDEEPRCVIVVGASGSGKSSLLHAGVVPALWRQSGAAAVGRLAPLMLSGSSRTKKLSRARTNVLLAVLAPRRVLPSTASTVLACGCRPAGSRAPIQAPMARSRAAGSTAVSTRQIVTRSGTWPCSPALPAVAELRHGPTPRSLSTSARRPGSRTRPPPEPRQGHTAPHSAPVTRVRHLRQRFQKSGAERICRPRRDGGKDGQVAGYQAGRGR